MDLSRGLQHTARLILASLFTLSLAASDAPSTPSASASTQAPAQGLGQGTRLGGWIPYWAFPAGLESARAAKGRLNDAFVFAAQLDEAGTPVLACPEAALVATAGELRSLGVTTWLTVVNDRMDASGKATMKDPDIIHKLVASDTPRRAHVARLVELCRHYGFQGLDLDYENLNPGDREAFSLFAAELGTALHAAKLQFSVTLEPRTGDTASGVGRAADWVQLGKAADRLQIMLYNLHYGGSAPGPVATPAWIARVMAFAATQCPKAKLVPSLKVSGFEWGPKPRGIAFRELEARRRSEQAQFQREPEGDTPFLSYSQRGAKHTSYCDDALSLMTKLKFTRGLGYPAATLWSLGTEDPAFWAAAK